jgi:hypothetical protein
MARRSKSGKEVVRAESAATKGSGSDAAEPARSDWKPTPEHKSKATRFRLIAAVLWVLAIAGELFGIFYVLDQDPVSTWLLIGVIVVVGALAMGGSYLWKKANRLDPASRSEPVRFFVQNQLGAIITIIAFLPLIVLIFADKDMDGRQKAIAGGIAVAVMIGATLFGVDFDSPSTEQYASEEADVIAITGENLVFWTKSGEVFHLCEDASAVNLESKDNKIYSGTVADAHADGKDRLTLQIESEKRQCGFAEAPASAVGSPAPEPATPEAAKRPAGG